MAKGNLFLGNGRGSVGDITLSVLNGKQLSRRRARVVANPQSASQQLQRMIMSTVTGNAARLRSLISHSFQGVKAGADSFNYFNRVNLRLLRSQAVSGQIQGFRIKGAETFTPCEGMILGKGIITAPPIQITQSGVIFSNAFIPASFTDEQSYLNCLAATFNAAPGDEIAILFVRQSSAIAAEYNGFYQPKCELAVRRLVFLPWDSAFVGQSLLGSVRSINSALLDYSIGGDGKPRTIDSRLKADAPGTGQLQMYIDESNYVAGAAFLSRTDGQGGWYNSNTTLVVSSSIYYKNDEIVASDIQGSYGPAAAQEPVSDYYLEQSITEGAAPFVPQVLYGLTGASESTVNWTYLAEHGELAEEAPNITGTKSDVSEGGVTIGLNFVPTSIHTVGDYRTQVVRLLPADVPAGKAMYQVFIDYDAEVTRNCVVEFKAPDGSIASTTVGIQYIP